MKKKQFTVFGVKVRAHDATCADGFREDRKHGVIYTACEGAEKGTTISWEQASNDWNMCVYCGLSSVE